jgi:hypothetical protein
LDPFLVEGDSLAQFENVDCAWRSGCADPDAGMLSLSALNVLDSEASFRATRDHLVCQVERTMHLRRGDASLQDPGRASRRQAVVSGLVPPLSRIQGGLESRVHATILARLARGFRFMRSSSDADFRPLLL